MPIVFQSPGGLGDVPLVFFLLAVLLVRLVLLVAILAFFGRLGNLAVVAVRGHRPGHVVVAEVGMLVAPGGQNRRRKGAEEREEREQAQEAGGLLAQGKVSWRGVERGTGGRAAIYNAPFGSRGCVPAGSQGRAGRRGPPKRQLDRDVRPQRQCLSLCSASGKAR